MKKIISLLLVLLVSFILVACNQSLDNDYATRNIELDNVNLDFTEYRQDVLSGLDFYEAQIEESLISFSGSLSYSTNNFESLSTEKNLVIQDMEAYYDLQSNVFYAKFTIYDEHEVEVIEFSITPEFIDQEEKDIILEIDGIEHSLADVFLKNNRIDNLCFGFDMNPGSSQLVLQSLADCGGGGGGGGGAVITLFAIVVVPLANTIVEVVVDAATTVVYHVSSFFKWIYTSVTNAVTGTTTVVEEEHEYNFEIDGITYNAVRVHAQSELNEFDEDKYYIVLIDYGTDHPFFIVPIPVSKNMAASILASGAVVPSIIPPSNPSVNTLYMTLSIYTRKQTNAYDIAFAAGGNLLPKGPEIHSDKGGIQLPHYHPFGKQHAHALFIIYNK
ncbi:MAG: hypothetical protein GX312_05505 [Candidatus Phytoplasma sp.]|nr:hypothetical protein [Phytoplasma sp.]